MAKRHTSKPRRRPQSNVLQVRVMSPRIAWFGFLKCLGKFAKLAVVLALIGSAGWGAWRGIRHAFYQNPDFRLQVIDLNPNNAIDEIGLVQIAGIDLSANLFDLDISEIKERLFDFIQETWNVGRDRVQFREDRVIVGNREMKLGELANAAYQARVQLSAAGFYKTPKITWDRARATGRPFYYFAYGAACSEVTVDTMTGEMKVDRADILHDVGKSLNPAIDTGQIEGGFIQGMGWLTTEQLVWDSAGRLRTHAPSTYKIPAASDTPRDFRVALYESGGNREDAIYRSKAVGEPPIMLANSVFCAINDAILSLRPAVFPKLDAPATPEAIMRAIRATNAGDG